MYNEAGAFQGAGATGSNVNFMVSASAVPMVDGLTVAFGHSKDSNDVAGTVEDKN